MLWGRTTTGAYGPTVMSGQRWQGRDAWTVMSGPWWQGGDTGAVRSGVQVALDDGDRAAREEGAVTAQFGADEAAAGGGLEAGELRAAQAL